MEINSGIMYAHIQIQTTEIDNPAWVQSNLHLLSPINSSPVNRTLWLNSGCESCSWVVAAAAVPLQFYKHFLSNNVYLVAIRCKHFWHGICVAKPLTKLFSQPVITRNFSQMSDLTTGFWPGAALFAKHALHFLCSLRLSSLLAQKCTCAQESSLDGRGSEMSAVRAHQERTTEANLQSEFMPTA